MHTIPNEVGALTRVERRELAAFMRDQRTEQRVRTRGGEAVMPSLADLVERRREPSPLREIDLLSSFNRARDRSNEPPDLLAAFSRAAKGRDGKTQDAAAAASTLEQARPPTPHDNDGPQRGRDRT